jgi:hypothetical protein
LVWFGLIWFGLVWFGLVWFDLIWFDLPFSFLLILHLRLWTLSFIFLLIIRERKDKRKINQIKPNQIKSTQKTSYFTLYTLHFIDFIYSFSIYSQRKKRLCTLTLHFYQTKPKQSNQTESNQTKPNQTKPNQTKSKSQTKPNILYFTL